MNVVKRIIVLASSSAMLIGLGGCSVIDSLNLGQLLRPGVTVLTLPLRRPHLHRRRR